VIPEADAAHRDLLDDYIDAQVHGPVILTDHVEAVVLDPSHRGTDVERAGHLLSGIQATVTGLDLDDLHRAARATAEVLTHVSELAATAHAAQLPAELARHVTADLSAVTRT